MTNIDRKSDIKVYFYIKDDENNTIDPSITPFEIKFYTNPNQKIVKCSWDLEKAENVCFGPTNELFVCLSTPYFQPGVLRGEISFKLTDGCFKDNYFDNWIKINPNILIIDNTKIQ